MAGKTRQRKSHSQRPPKTLGEWTFASAAHKPWQIAALCAILVVVTVFSFRGVLTNDFVALDDSDYVLLNRHVQQGVNMQSIAWAFTTFQQGNWHPLTWISHMMDWSLYGNSPGGHHMTNVCLHAANVVLLFMLFLCMTGFLWRSAMVAFLFALHPAHVESVAWISERKDLLCTLFWFAALLAYAWYVRRPSWKRYLCVACCFACGLMSKPMIVTLPFTLLLLDFWPLRRITFTPELHTHWLSTLWKLCVEKWLLFILAAISCVITFIAQRTGGAVATLQELSFGARICNAAISYCRYIRITFWPDPLIVYYFHEKNNIMVAAAVLSAIALILVTAVCWHFRKQRPYCLIGWLWFLGTLTPVIGIVQVGHQAMAERYTYVPLVGLFIAIVWLAGDVVANFPKMRILTQLLAAAVILACAVKTGAQVKVWENTVTLLSHTLEVDPRGEFPNVNLGAAYARLGRYAEAQKYFDRALDYAPSEPVILSYSAFNLMLTHDQSKLPQAGQRLQQALRLAPGNPEILTYLALWSAFMGRPMDEEMYCRQALAAHPDLVTARLYLGDALQAQGKLDEAVLEYRHVLAVEPDSYNAHNSLGMIFNKQGLTEEALKEYWLSLAIQPNQVMAHSKMGKILMEMHRLPEAVEQFSDAVRIDPANAEARHNLDLAQARMKNETVLSGRE